MVKSSRTASKTDGELAYVLLRATLGLNILMHGLSRLLAGTGTFARTLVPMFAKTPLPSWSVYVFGLALPFIETLLGILLLVGLKTRWALVGGCGLLFVLTFGSSLRQDWEITALQLIYTVVYTALLAGIRWNWFSMDTLLQRPADDCAPCSGSAGSTEGYS
jgi:thiosulfate dehydrogenase [quinone] large subunit